MFKFLAKLSSMFATHRNRMSQQHEEESFSSLLVEDLCTNTDAFLTVYRDGISRSSDPVAALTRFQVQIITGNKSKEFSEHEHISVTVLDRETDNLYNFYIERNASQNDVQAESPIPTTLASVSTSPITSASAAPDKTSDAPSPESYPLLTLNNPSESPLPSPSASQSSLSQAYPFRERLTLALTQAIHSSSTSLDCSAEDRILGRGMFVRNGPNGLKIIRDIGHIVRQISPVDLSLFELGILVDTIHNEVPIYSLLTNQCYWFMHTICDIVVMLYGDKVSMGSKGSPIPSDYLPNLAGRWKNVRIVAPKEDSLRRMAIKFSERQEKEFAEVHNARQQVLQHDIEMEAMRHQISHLLHRIGQLEGSEWPESDAL